VAMDEAQTRRPRGGATGFAAIADVDVFYFHPLSRGFMTERPSAWQMRTPARAWRSIVNVALVVVVLAMAPPTRAAEDKIGQVHRIAIIAALGDRVMIWAHGWTDKDNHLGYRSIDGWGLDDLAKQTAIKLIGDRFQIVPITYDSSSFIVPDEDVPSEELPKLQPLILALPPLDVDAYLVIRKRTWHQSAPYILDGLTAMSEVLFRSRDVFVTMQVDLVDARTGKTLSIRRLSATAGLSREAWADTPEQISDVKAQNLRRRIEELITRNLTDGMKSMGLTGKQLTP